MVRDDEGEGDEGRPEKKIVGVKCKLRAILVGDDEGERNEGQG